jgi:hypothetical protein
LSLIDEIVNDYLVPLSAYLKYASQANLLRSIQTTIKKHKDQLTIPIDIDEAGV